MLRAPAWHLIGKGLFGNSTRNDRGLALRINSIAEYMEIVSSAGLDYEE